MAFGEMTVTIHDGANKEQTVRVHFNGTEDSSLQTSFIIDGTALNVTAVNFSTSKLPAACWWPIGRLTPQANCDAGWSCR